MHERPVFLSYSFGLFKSRRQIVMKLHKFVSFKLKQHLTLSSFRSSTNTYWKTFPTTWGNFRFLSQAPWGTNANNLLQSLKPLLFTRGDRPRIYSHRPDFKLILIEVSKVHIIWEGPIILQNRHLPLIGTTYVEQK